MAISKKEYERAEHYKEFLEGEGVRINLSLEYRDYEFIKCVLMDAASRMRSKRALEVLNNIRVKH